MDEVSNQSPTFTLSAACAAASRATGTRYGRAAHVIEADLVEEVDRRRVAAVLAADPELEVGAAGAALLHRHGHELAGAGRVEARKRILLENLAVLVDAQELADVVS